MADKSVPLSVRMTNDDIGKLSALKVPDSVTPSEKLRRLVRTAYRQQQGRGDFDEALKVEEERMQPLLHAIRAAEAEHRVHSAFLLNVAGWLPDMCAAAMAAMARAEAAGKANESPAALEEIEADFADRVFGLMLTALNFSLTPKAHFYRPEVVAERLPEILEIARLLDRNTEHARGGG